MKDKRLILFDQSQTLLLYYGVTKTKKMTIPEIKELVNETKDLTQEEMQNVSTHLHFFDRVNYVAWVEKLIGIKLHL